jgi:flagellar protein FlaI
MNVPKSLIAANKLFVHILRLERGGTVARKVIRIDETRGYDPASDEIELGRLVQWRSREDDWVLLSTESSFVKAIAELLVVSPREIWHDLERRATIIKWLAERNADMLEVHETVRRYMRDPEKVYEEALKETSPYVFRKGGA